MAKVLVEVINQNADGERGWITVSDEDEVDPRMLRESGLLLTGRYQTLRQETDTEHIEGMLGFHRASAFLRP